MKAKVRKILIEVAKVGLAFGIIAFILGKLVDEDPMETLGLAFSNWPWVLLGAALFGVCLLTVTVRWELLLRAQGIPIPFRRLTAVNFIGHFFNSFMLGSTGGDLVKAFYTAKESGDKKTEGAASVFIDRIMGLVALLILALLMCALNFPLYRDNTDTHLTIVFLAGVTAATIALFVVSFSHNAFERWAVLRWMLKKFPRIGAITQRVYDSFYLYRDKPRVLSQTVALSFFNQVILVFMAWAFGHSIGAEVTLWQYMAVIPLANMIGSIPITPGGLGARETAYLVLLAPFAVSRGDAVIISLLFYGGVLLWSVVGGIVFLFFSSSSGHSVREEMQELKDAERDAG